VCLARLALSYAFGFALCSLFCKISVSDSASGLSLSSFFGSLLFGFLGPQEFFFQVLGIKRCEGVFVGWVIAMKQRHDARESEATGVVFIN
jgi:hypothetical protein